MTKPVYNWRLVRGEVYRTTMRLRQPNGQPVDLTGCTLVTRPQPGPLAASIADAAQGLIQVEVQGLQVGRYPYEIAITWPDLSRWIILMGYVLVEEGPYAEP